MTWNTLKPTTRAELAKRLTQRQLDVLILWLAGCSYERIAGMLTIAPRTVRTHLKRARTVLDDIRQKEAA